MSRPVIAGITTGDIDRLGRLILDALAAEFRYGMHAVGPHFTLDQRDSSHDERESAVRNLWNLYSELVGKV